MDKETFLKTKKLYHYTKLQSAIMILQSQSLLFGSLPDMNDINESFRPLYHDDYFNENDLEEELSLYRQISLTHDGRRKGYDIAAMWCHYADKGNGVCIVLDKEKLKTKIKPLSDISAKNVHYLRHYSPSIYAIGKGEDNNVPRFFKNHQKEIFFEKSFDWSYEQEFRVLIYNSGENKKPLGIQDCILAVIMNYAVNHDKKASVFGSTEAHKINKLLPQGVPLLEYGRSLNKTNLRDMAGVDWSGNQEKVILRVN